MSRGSGTAKISVKRDGDAEGSTPGQLKCRQDSVVFQGDDGSVVDVSLDELEAIEVEAGHGLTAEAAIALFVTMMGVVVAIGSMMNQTVPVFVPAAGWFVLIMGLVALAVYYDTTSTLRLYVGAGTFVFNGSVTELKDFGQNVRDAR